MNMGLGYWIIEYAIIIELVLIAIILLSTYLIKYITTANERRKQKLSAEVEKYFRKLISSRENFRADDFPHKWKKIDILFNVMVKLDTEYQNDDTWLAIRSNLLNHILLPLARKHADSRRWPMRFFSCKVFELVTEKQDEPAIIKLTEDPVSLVYVHAISAAIKCGSERAINNIITRMAKVSWITQPMYLAAFKDASPEIRNFVEKRLRTSNDPSTRAECYKILLQFPPGDTKFNIDEDIKSKNLELRLAALKYITHVDKQAAMPILIDRLKDENWEVRLVALHRLGMLDLTSDAVPQVAALLDDPDWWIKISAAEVLKGLGKEGEQILKSQAPDLSLIPFDARSHVSHTLW